MIAYIFSVEFTKLRFRMHDSSISIYITNKILETYDQIEKFILHPKNRIMFINGNIGSGKTTNLLYVALKLKKKINYRVVYFNFALMPNKNFKYYIMAELFFTFAKEIENNIEIRNLFKLIFHHTSLSIVNAVEYLEQIKNILLKENIKVILFIDQIETYTESENRKEAWIDTLNEIYKQYDLYIVVCTSENDFSYLENMIEITDFVKLSDTFNLKEFKKFILLKGAEKIYKLMINNIDNCSDYDMKIIFNELLHKLDEHDYDKKSKLHDFTLL